MKMDWDRAAPYAHNIADSVEGRQHPRFSLRMPVLCGNLSVPGSRTFGSSQNVSRGGLLLEVPEPLVPGTRTSLLLVAGDRNARVEATVVWVAEDTPCRMGLRFVKWFGTSRLAWERLLASKTGPTSRASVRFPVSFDMTCRVPPDVRVFGLANNLSEGGVMVTLDSVLPLHTHVTVASIILSRMEVEMEVVWARAVLGGREVLHGLRFVRDDIDKELFLISALLRQILDESFLGE